MTVEWFVGGQTPKPQLPNVQLPTVSITEKTIYFDRSAVEALGEGARIKLGFDPELNRLILQKVEAGGYKLSKCSRTSGAAVIQMGKSAHLSGWLKDKGVTGKKSDLVLNEQEGYFQAQF